MSIPTIVFLWLVSLYTTIYYRARLENILFQFVVKLSLNTAFWTLFWKILLSLLTLPPCITSMLNIGGWDYLPRAEARGSLVTVPIVLRATLCLIRQISIWLSLVFLVISVSLLPYLPILLSLSLSFQLLHSRLPPHLVFFMPLSYP